MIINKSLIKKEEWFDLDDSQEVSFKIRPFPASHNVLRSIGDSDNVDIWWKMFNYSLVEWKGVYDKNEVKMECNDENKKVLFDYSQDVMMFVCNKCSSKNEDIITLEKKT